MPVGWGKKSVRLLEVTPQAEWDEATTKWTFASLSRVEFGGGYEEALYEVAGAPPLQPTTG